MNPNTTNYYRIVKINATTYHHELISLPPNDPSTDVIRRISLEFDANDNVIKSANDLDVDGVFENYKTYTYNESDNLIAIENEDGDIQTFSYPNVKNTQGFITRATFGKKNLNLHNAESFGLLSSQEDLPNSVSVHISNLEIVNFGYVFELDESGYFTKRTSITNQGIGTRTAELSYTFQ